MSQYFGTSKLDTAQKCFADNVNNHLNTNFNTNPESFNLYNGLQNLAGAVEDIQNQLSDVQRTLAHLIQRLS
jgi:hypothetical protein